MKKKRGFTLIELLAVIIILAVIALIAVPLVMSTINDAKKGAAINSGYGLITAIEHGLAVEMIQDTGATYASGSVTLSNGVYYFDGTKALSVSYKGNPATDVSLQVSNGVVVSGMITIDGFNLTVGPNGSIQTDEAPLVIGPTYKKPIATDTHLGIVYLDPTNLGAYCDEESAESTTNTKEGCMKWYVYKDNGDGTVQAILDHNTTALTVYDFENKNGTTGNERESNEHEADWEVQQLVSTFGWKLVTRLPRAQEIVDIAHVGTQTWDAAKHGSTINMFYFGTNSPSDTSQRLKYDWLYDHMNCSEGACSHPDNGGYSSYVSNTATAPSGSFPIFGYWLDTPVSETSNNVWHVYADGYLYDNSAYYPVAYGVRPVITVSKSLIGMNN